MKRIGFLFNHDELHQVAHTAPIISALQSRSPSTSVEVITSSEAQIRTVKQFLDPAMPVPSFWSIKPRGWSRFVEKLLGNLIPIGRLNGLINNIDLFRYFDALVVPETTSTILKTKNRLSKTKLIFFPHGAGDRSVGFSSEISLFDFVLLPGMKTRARMLDAGVICKDNHRVVGYPKFEAFEEIPPPKLFNNSNPIVLYNPHFDPRLSSWFKFGEGILDFFANQNDYNLIVAPHVMLFRRRMLASLEHRIMKFRRNIPQRYLNLPNILIDTGSKRSVDMTYNRAANIYLGDVSSQIYEYIRTPRPAIFLNSHDADWQSDPNYACWHFGSVLENTAELHAALDNAPALFKHFAHRQKQAFSEAFNLSDNISSADRAASALVDFLDLPLSEEVKARQALVAQIDAQH